MPDPVRSDPGAASGVEGLRLSEAQERVLRLVCRRDAQLDGPLSTPEISRILSRGFDDWARGKLLALEKRGLVVRLGTTFSGGQCWGPTAAARGWVEDQVRRMRGAEGGA